MKKVFRANLYFFIIMILSIFVPDILAYIYYLVGMRDVRVALVLNHLIIFLVPAIIYINVTKSNVKKTFKLNKLHLKDIGMIFLLSIVARPAMTLCSLITAMFFDNNVAQMLDMMSSTPFIILVCIVAVLPSITEEVTLRGVVLSGYEDKGMIKASVMTGLLFGIFHLDGQQFLYATMLGIVLSLLVRITNSIFASALLHFLINGTSVALQQLLLKIPNMGEVADNVSIKDLQLSEKLMMLQTYLIPAIISIGLCILILMKMKKWSDERKGIYTQRYSNNPQVDRYFAGDNVNLREKNVDNNMTYSDERVINIPFILTVIVYVGFMILNNMSNGL
ncbi:MAG: lysostaphin resistance A-like protein [Clostridium sp.]